MKLPRLRVPSIPWRRITAGRLLPWTLFVVTLAVAMFNWYQWRGLHAEANERTDVRATAQAFLHALTNFEATTIDDDVERIRGFAVGDFADQVDQTFDSARIAQIRKARVTSTGDVRSVFVEDVHGDDATAFGVVDERITNNVSSTARNDVLRIELHLVRTPSGWKVERVDILQVPAEQPVPGA